MKRRETTGTPEVCPVCGVEVPPRATVCPGCGADETSGWSEAARYDSLGLPDEEFDYEAYVKEEFGGGGKRVRGGWWWVVAVGVTAAFIWMAVRGWL